MAETATPVAGRARLIPALSRPAWLVLTADALSAVGSGLSLPFLLIYLSQVRGIGLTTAGLAAAMVPLASLAGNPIGGALADRASARNTLIGGLTACAAGTGSLAFVQEPWQAFPAALLLGFGASVVWPSQDALLATTVEPEQRSGLFSVRFATMNAGLGAGALLGAVFVDVQRPDTFIAVYLLDAVSFLVAIPIITFGVTCDRPDHHPTNDETNDAPQGYRAVFADRTFRRVWVLTAMVITVSYGQLHSGFPAYAARPDGIAASHLGFAYAANTITIVLAQLLVLRLVTGHTRTHTLAAACVCWAGAWVVTLTAGTLGHGSSAVAGFAIAMVIFAFAETLLSPTIPAIVNDLAPDQLRGRYNGAATLAWTTGFTTGPLLAGATLALNAGPALFTALVGAALATAWAATRLAQHLHPDINRITQ